jgi:Rho-binding antiterminator
MDEERYEPVSCDYHDQLEEAATLQKDVELEFDLEGVAQRDRGRIADVYTSHGAEYVRFLSSRGLLEIRLDHIIAMRDA